MNDWSSIMIYDQFEQLCFGKLNKVKQAALLSNLWKKKNVWQSQFKKLLRNPKQNPRSNISKTALIGFNNDREL